MWDSVELDPTLLTPDPMPEESTDPSVLKESWQTPSNFTGSNAFPEAASIFKALDGSIIKYWVLQKNKPFSDYKPQDMISFGSGKDYTSLEGSLGTPLIGKNDISDLIIFPVCFTSSTSD